MSYFVRILSCAGLLWTGTVQAQLVLWTQSDPATEGLGSARTGKDPLWDFDGDDVPDVLVRRSTAPKGVLLSGQDGRVLATFDSPRTLTASPDLNGDGIPEVWALRIVAGVHSYVLLSGASLDMAAHPLAVVPRPTSGEFALHYDVLSAGEDATGDGVGDLLGLHGGAVRLYSGAALADGSADEIRSFRPPPDDLRASFEAGWNTQVALVSDLDGDGQADVLASDSDFAPDEGPQSDFGVVYAFSGRTGALLHRLRPPDAPFGARLFGETALAVIGGTVGPGAGSDLTGDDVPDIVVGSGIFDPNPDGVIELFDGATGMLLRKITFGENLENANFARLVRLVPDIDGDGAADILAGSLVPASNQDLAPFAVIAYSSGTGNELWRILEPQLDSAFGTSYLASAGDLDGDGRADLFIGAPFVDTDGQENAGAVYAISAPVPVASEAGAGSSAVSLSASPNPSRSGPDLRFVLGEAAHVRLSVLDALGREVVVVAEGVRAAGPHRVGVSRALAPGVYVARLAVDGAVTTRTMSVVR